MKCTTTTLALLVLAGSAGIASAQNLFFGSAGGHSGRNSLYTTDLNGLGSTDILPTPMVVSGVAVDGGAGRVFWQEPHHGSGRNQWSIHSANLNGSAHSVVSSWTQSSGNTYGVAADRTNRQVYWADINGISRANYNGSATAAIVSFHHVNEVEVDPAANRLFWAGYDSGGNVGIWSSTLNGASPTLLRAIPGAAIISGLTVDPTSSTLFWVDYTSGTVSSMDYAGGSITTLLSSPFVSGAEFEPVTNRLYLASKSPPAGRIAWMPPTGGPVTTVYTGIGQGEMWDVGAIVPAPGSLALLAAGAFVVRRRRL